MCFGLHFLLAGHGHGTTLFGLGLGDVLVGIGLIHLEGSTDVLAYVDVGDVDGENFEGRTCVKPLAEHELRDGVGVLEHGLVAFARADGRNDAFAYTSQHRVFACTTHQLADVGTNRHARLGDELDAVLGYGGHGRSVDDLGVDRHLNGFEDVAPRQVDGGGHLEGQVDVCLGGRHEGVYHLFDVSACQIVGFEAVACDVAQACLVGFDEPWHDDVGRHVTDAHQEELHQRDVDARHLGREPEEEGHIMEKQNQKDDASHDEEGGQVQRACVHFQSYLEVDKLSFEYHKSQITITRFG